MSIRNSAKKIWFSLYNSGRIVLLDFPVIPVAHYSQENGHAHQRLLNLIADNTSHYERILQATLKYKNAFATITQDKLLQTDTDPGWNNGYLPGLDIIMLYSLLGQLHPSMYVEIGSGTSTKVAFKSRKENCLDFEIISIDPSPRKNISKVSDKIYCEKLQQTDTSIFEALKENDVLFLDGTHMLYPNSEVMWFFMEVFPILKKGVIVHIHDIYLPYDYPDFMLKRYYNEQYILGTLLLTNPEKYEIVCPNYFIYTNKSLHKILNPVWELSALKNVEQHGGSFWIRIQ